MSLLVLIAQRCSAFTHIQNISIVNDEYEKYVTNYKSIPSKGSSMCYCEGYMKIDQSIYPGQDLALQLKSLSGNGTVVYVASQNTDLIQHAK